MDHSPRRQIPLYSSPFQSRAFHFLKRLSILGRESGTKSKDTLSPVALPARHFHHAHSSIDLLRKPELPGLIGFRAEDGPNAMDTDDLSRDPSASGNSPHLLRRHSALDSLHSPLVHSPFTGHGATSLSFHDQAGLPNQNLSSEPGDLLAPAPLSLPFSPAIVESTRSTPPTPDIPTQFSVSPQWKPDEQAVQDTPNNDTPRLPGDVLSHHDTFMNPSTDSASSTSSDLVTHLRTQSVPDQDGPTLEIVEEHPPLLSHHALSPPPFCVTTERGLRLSPSIVIRQPMPLLNLPALPPPPSPCTPPKLTTPLRSIPLLSRHGRITGQAGHERATPGDSDEDDGNEGETEPADTLSVHQSDEEDDELPSAGPSGMLGLKSSQKQRMRDGESLAESPISPMSTQDDFVGLNPTDHFCSETNAEAVHFMLPSDPSAVYPSYPNAPSGEDATWLHLAPNLPTSGIRLERMPSLYRIDSRSMVDLGSSRRGERALPPLRSKDAEPTSTLGPPTETREESEESDMEAAIGRLLRRTSMPSFHPTSDPPPYPTFNPRSRDGRIAPGDDEGRERLPPYSNSLYLAAVMPRKMEFSSPGVQAKDRKWRRVLCELEGTALRVYKCPAGSSGAGALGDWWEKRVGVGDVACPNPPRSRKGGPGEQFKMPAKLGIDESPVPLASSISTSPALTTSARSSESQSTTTTPRPAKRLSAANLLSPFRSSGLGSAQSEINPVLRPEGRQLELFPVDGQQCRSSHESTGRATFMVQQPGQPAQARSAARISFLPAATGRTQWRNGEMPRPPMTDLLRAYTLQHAESGLGNDYLKRRNVIRVRLEGEQFLMQAPDIPAVVEWIEGLHAGTNIALDIDQRPMPRGPMFPRRRRRRSQHNLAEDASGQRLSTQA